ncbi:uncharacterized protein LOC144160898 [Haemaphysalis longicornis]
MVSSNHFLLFVQLFAVISTSSPVCVEPHAPGTPHGTCPRLPEPSRCCPVPLQPAVPVTPQAAIKPTASTSSSHPESYKYSQSCTAHLSVQWNGAAATMVSSNHFLLFVQLFAVISTSSPVCVEPHAPGTPHGTCPRLPEPSRCCPVPLQPPVPVTPQAAIKPTASTSSSHPESYKYSQPCTAHLSGQWNGAAATMASSNHFLLFVQVGPSQDYNAKRSSNYCLLLLPCPHVLLDIIADCFLVVKELLLLGDIEQNPGPNSEVLAAISKLTAHLDERHDNLQKSINDVKENQLLLDSKATDLTARLTVLEQKVTSLESVPDDTQMQGLVTAAVRHESAALSSRLDDFEDRSRRDNLIFYGLLDSVSETWAESELKVREILSASLKLELPNEAISRAHRIGTFVQNKCRPVIVRFSSFKTREGVFAKKSMLRSTPVSVSEDFCKATRNIQKKLLNFAKTTGQPYYLKYNKIVINKKSYVYCPVTDRVTEAGPIYDNPVHVAPQATNSESAGTSAPPSPR